MNRLDNYSLNLRHGPSIKAMLNDGQINHYHSSDEQLDHHHYHNTTPPTLMPSPPELLHDSGEDESDDDMIQDHVSPLPYLVSNFQRHQSSSSPVSVLRQRESSIRSDSKPSVSFDDTTKAAQEFGAHHQRHFTTARQNRLSAHRSKFSSSPEEDSQINRRKSIPHRSPAAIQDALQATALDQSIVFQLNVSGDLFDHQEWIDKDNIGCKPEVICGESLLTALQSRVTSARHERSSMKPKQTSPRRHIVAHKINIPRSPKSLKRRKSPEAVSPSELANAFTDMTVYTPHSDEKHHHRRAHAIDYRAQLDNDDEDEDETLKSPISSEEVADKSASPSTTSHRSKSKGPCQACQEVSDGCMRKGFNWPFEASLIYYDKGKPFVYLCNKCGLRYNKSNGCVCRNCRWVFCKEEKRKALQHIEKMRASRPDGQIDMDEFIEGFVCSPKYWTCGQKWRVSWVLNANANE
ncbi:hypothetical protein K450DRAFT_240826 [Umbelopsis ramanniana AG]|uniref:Uncharacterized protein n=1 Tax=Umbelopsis ramanniana AG TaxID=1314678 RepID=A0AAD5E968_UMBRA|nr:uncharacterized protein K450DRAFT_240826 [Umbelopsis ramanniana AG]KAI8579651.1 hypothetical protein K450DRAFT_240826 [Umbelopsis ramanniana AG]